MLIVWLGDKGHHYLSLSCIGFFNQYVWAASHLFASSTKPLCVRSSYSYDNIAVLLSPTMTCLLLLLCRRQQTNCIDVSFCFFVLLQKMIAVTSILSCCFTCRFMLHYCFMACFAAQSATVCCPVPGTALHKCFKQWPDSLCNCSSRTVPAHMLPAPCFNS